MILDKEFILKEIEEFINANCYDYAHCKNCPIGEDYNCSLESISNLSMSELVYIYYKINKERSSIKGNY